MMEEYKAQDSTGFENLAIESWEIGEICEWLDSIGMGRYKESFKKLDMNGKCLIRLADKHLEDDLNIKFEFHRVAIISEINKEKGFKIVVGNTYEHRPEDMKNPHYWKIYVELADRDVKSEDIIEKVVFDLGSVKKDLKGIYTQHPFHHYIWGSPAVSYVVPVHIYWKAPLGIPTTIFNYEIFLGATGRQISFVKQFDKYKLFLDI